MEYDECEESDDNDKKILVIFDFDHTIGFNSYLIN